MTLKMLTMCQLCLCRNVSEAQSDECRSRIDRRRLLVEAAELDKENERQAEEHIHVECVIGLLKNKYTILQGTLPVTFLLW